MGSVCPSDRSDYLKAAEASIYINVEQRGRVRGCEVGSEEWRRGPVPRSPVGLREEVRLLAQKIGSHSGDGSLWIKSHWHPGAGNGGFCRPPISISARVLTQALPAPLAKMGRSG